MIDGCTLMIPIFFNSHLQLRWNIRVMHESSVIPAVGKGPGDSDGSYGIQTVRILNTFPFNGIRHNGPRPGKGDFPDDMADLLCGGRFHMMLRQKVPSMAQFSSSFREQLQVIRIMQQSRKGNYLSVRAFFFRDPQRCIEDPQGMEIVMSAELTGKELLHIQLRMFNQFIIQYGFLLNFIYIIPCGGRSCQEYNRKPVLISFLSFAILKAAIKYKFREDKSMDQNFQQLIVRMEANSRKQVAYARMQCVFSVVAALCCVALLITFIAVVPRLQTAAQQAEVVLSNLEKVTSELSEVELTGMVEHMDQLVSNVDGLVTTSQEGVESTMEKISAIDFETLNKAIEDLADVIEPIANFFNAFKK